MRSAFAPDESTLHTLADRIADRVAEQLTSRIAQLFDADSPAASVDTSNALPSRATATPALWTASRVAQHYGVKAGFVYQHADELGCIRLGEGARPRLRFDPALVRERWPNLGRGPEQSASTRRSTSRHKVRGTLRGPPVELLEFDRDP